MDFFKPPKWKYEPLAMKRARELSKFDAMTQQISPLVASGDPISLFKAKQVVQRQRTSPDQQALTKRGLLGKVGEDVRRRVKEAQVNQAALANAPTDLQVGFDQMSHVQTPSRPIPGVPRGVAEAFPATQGAGPAYTSGSSGPTNLNPLASLVDNPEGLPQPIQHALNTPVLGSVLTELARPANYVPIGRVGMARNLIQNVGGTLGAQALSDVAANTTENAPKPVQVGAQIAANLVGAVAGGGAADLATSPKALRGAGRAATTFRDITENIPVGASIKDISGDIPESSLTGDAGRLANEAKAQLRAKIQQDISIRNSGTTEAEKRAGRASQAAGYRSALQQGKAQGLTGQELANFAQRGASGRIIKTVSDPVSLSPDHVEALFNDAAASLADPSSDAFQSIQLMQALNKAVDPSPQVIHPYEIEALRPLIGDKLANELVRAQKAAQPPTGSSFGSRTVRGQGPKLPGVPGMPKTGPNVPRPSRGSSGVAFQREMDAAARAGNAERSAAERAAAAEHEALLRAEAEHRRNVAPDFLSNPARPAQRTGFPTSAMPGVPTASRSTGTDLLRDPRAAQSYVSGMRQAEKSAAAQALKQAGPTEEALMEKVNTLLATESRDLNIPGAAALKEAKPEVAAAIDYWLKGNRDILDNMGPEGNQLIANVGAQLSGNVADSYLSAALSRRNILAESLRSSWGEPATAAAAADRDKIITKVSDALLQRELKLRYGNNVPERVQNLLKTTASLPYDESLGALTTLTQRAKNTMFGVLDVGVFGVQALNAIRRGGIPLMAAEINRGLAAMHLPNVATSYADGMLSKQIQYGLDGVAQGARTGAFSRKQGAKDVGSLLQYLGKPGRMVDRPYMAAADKMSQIQFGTVLGGLRNASYEGDLVIAHLLGQDITKPSVRQAAAANANAIGSFAQSALRKSRSQKEGVAFTSAPMVRARVNQITQMARVFGPKATPTERIVGSMMIASTVGYTLATGKLLNDWIGVGDFEFDPSKPGFGQITLPSGLVIQTVPQGSVERAFSRSIRALSEADPVVAGKAWTDMYLGSAGPVPRTGLAAVDVGYQPNAGYKYGDLGGNKFLNLAPLPPVIQSRLNGQGNDPLQIGLGELGVTSFPEDARTKATRVFNQETGGDWKTATAAQARAFKAQHPDIAKQLTTDAISSGGKFGEAAKVKDEYQQKQVARDTQLTSGQMARQDYVNQYYDDLTAKRAKLEQIYGATPITKPKNPLEHYIQILQQSTDETTGVLNRDKVDAGMASLTAADQKYIDSHVGMDDTPLTALFRDIRKVRNERNDLPKYAGFDAKQAQGIDDAWQEVRNLAKSADRVDMLRALRQYLATADDLDAAIVAGVRRRINGTLRTIAARQNFDKAHPQMKIFYGSGKLTPAEIESLQKQLKAAA